MSSKRLASGLPRVVAFLVLSVLWIVPSGAARANELYRMSMIVTGQGRGAVQTALSRP